MDSSKQNMHPSLIVINDEILSTQVRLMELYVKQAQATAANEAARAQERFQAELTALQKELKQKELALETQQTISHQADQDLRAEASRAASAQLLRLSVCCKFGKTELDSARSDAHALQQRIAQSGINRTKSLCSIESRSSSH